MARINYSVKGKALGFSTKQFRGKPKRGGEGILQGYHSKEWERVGNIGVTTSNKRSEN